MKQKYFESVWSNILIEIFKYLEHIYTINIIWNLYFKIGKYHQLRSIIVYYITVVMLKKMERYPRDTNSSQIIKHFRLKCFIISSRFLVLCTTCLCDIGFVHKRKDKCRVKKYQKFKFKWSKIKFVEVVEYDTHFETRHNTTWCVLENPISRNRYIQKYVNSFCWNIIFLLIFQLVYSISVNL